MIDIKHSLLQNLLVVKHKYCLFWNGITVSLCIHSQISHCKTVNLKRYMTSLISSWESYTVPITNQVLSLISGAFSKQTGLREPFLHYCSISLGIIYYLKRKWDVRNRFPLCLMTKFWTSSGKQITTADWKKPTSWVVFAYLYIYWKRIFLWQRDEN